MRENTSTAESNDWLPLAEGARQERGPRPLLGSPEMWPNSLVGCSAAGVIRIRFRTAVG